MSLDVVLYCFHAKWLANTQHVHIYGDVLQIWVEYIFQNMIVQGCSYEKYLSPQGPF